MKFRAQAGSVLHPLGVHNRSCGAMMHAPQAELAIIDGKLWPISSWLPTPSAARFYASFAVVAPIIQDAYVVSIIAESIQEQGLSEPAERRVPLGWWNLGSCGRRAQVGDDL